MDDFSLPPPIDGSWHLIDAEVTGLVAERLRDFDVIEKGQDIGPMRAMRLACYHDHLLCDVQLLQGRKPGPMICVMYGRDGVHALSGQSEVIHKLNAQTSPNLSSPDRQELYLRFFCAFVHGAQGPFEIVSGPDLIGLNKKEAAQITAPRFDAATDLWHANVLYSRTLFSATFRVDTNGVVKMEDDELIKEDVSRQPDIVFDGLFRSLRKEGV